MTDLMTDTESLALFTSTRSPDALADLVRRYVNLVYATARRLVGDAHADDVTQATFIVLLRRADRINPHTLPGWLVNTTRFVAKEAIRSKLCRAKHETRAATMRTELQTAPDEPTGGDLLPLLDEALSKLNETDRTAVVLRFLQGLSFAEVGVATGSTEEAARKRVGRAVERLRAIFMKQGVAPSLGGLMIVLAAQQAPPASAAAIAAASSAATGTTAASTLLAKGVISVMTWAKIKLTVMIVVATLLAGAAGIGVEVIGQAVARTPPALIQPSQPVVAAVQTLDGFGPVIEHVIARTGMADRLYDIDTDRLLPRPAGLDLNTSMPDPKTGADLAAQNFDGPASLRAFDFTASSLTVTGDTTWDTITPDVVRKMLTQAGTMIDQWDIGNDESGPPRVRIFRTREGTEGKFQQLGTTGNGQGVRIRLQLLTAVKPFKATLKNGVSVELLGLAENPSDGKPWWKPDGSPLVDRPYAKVGSEYVVSPASTAYEFAARLTKPPELPGEYSLASANAYGLTFNLKPVDSTGKAIDLFAGMSASPKADAMRPLRLLVMSGPWVDAQAVVPTFDAPSATPVEVKVSTGVVTFTKFARGKNEAILSIEMPLTRDADPVSLRVIARDRSGQTTYESTGGATSVNGDRVTDELHFAMKPDDIGEFRVQYRVRAGWVEFRNVSLKPGVKTDVQIVTSDDGPRTNAGFQPVIERPLAGR